MRRLFTPAIRVQIASNDKIHGPVHQFNGSVDSVHPTAFAIALARLVQLV
jgi:hypothetical protein